MKSAKGKAKKQSIKVNTNTGIPTPHSKNRVAFRYETEAFSVSGKQIMGRQSAGHAFLRAAIAANPGGEFLGYGPNARTAAQFAAHISSIDARAKGLWVMANRHDQLATLGTLHRPDPVIGQQARGRLRVGPQTYSITGITHTTATDAVMRALADIPIAPTMPWDAIICTSRAVHSMVTSILAEQEAYLAWRTGGTRTVRLQLPVIPLGVHCNDFNFGKEVRMSVRTGLKAGADTIVFLFTGRLSFHGKAHPYQMYRMLEDTTRETGKPVMLIQCGWFANETISKTFRQSAQALAPSVRHIFLDGRIEEQRRAAWAAADVFVSLSDNLQETFGLTLIEAMASGLPVIATDWDGYRDTVRHGKDGFLIPTYTPPAGLGDGLANHYASETINYDHYCALTSQLISVDARQLREAACALANDPALRRKMGESGQKHARQNFDWAHIYRRYEELWDELATRRAKAGDEAKSAPRCDAEQMDPFRLFASYPTKNLSADTLMTAAADHPSLDTILTSGLFPFAARDKNLVEGMHKLLAINLGSEGKSIQEIASVANMATADVLRILSFLAKIEFFHIQ